MKWARAEDPKWNQLTIVEQWFVAMSIIEGQVGNGGFHAVYYNNCQFYLPLALDGYSAIGATKHAYIIDKILATMSSDPWAGPPETWPDPSASNPPQGSADIGVFDEQWYNLDLTILDTLKQKYIDKHV